jgi:hypothetical protein
VLEHDAVFHERIEVRRLRVARAIRRQVIGAQRVHDQHEHVARFGRCGRLLQLRQRHRGLRRIGHRERDQAHRGQEHRRSPHAQQAAERLARNQHAHELRDQEARDQGCEHRTAEHHQALRALERELLMKHVAPDPKQPDSDRRQARDQPCDSTARDRLIRLGPLQQQPEQREADAHQLAQRRAEQPVRCRAVREHAWICLGRGARDHHRGFAEPEQHAADRTTGDARDRAAHRPNHRTNVRAPTGLIRLTAHPFTIAPRL